MAQGKVEIVAERCKGCGLCVELCPKHTLALADHADARGIYVAIVTDGDSCTGCGNCALVCPDVAVRVYRLERSIQNV